MVAGLGVEPSSTAYETVNFPVVLPAEHECIMAVVLLSRKQNGRPSH